MMSLTVDSNTFIRAPFSGGGGARVTRIFSGRTDRCTLCPTASLRSLNAHTLANPGTDIVQ